MGEFNPLRSVRLASQATDNYLGRQWEGYRAGKPLVLLLGAFSAGPIFDAMGLPWIFPDAVVAHIAGRRKQDYLLQLAQDRGYFPETCTYTSIHMATALLSDEEKEKGEPDWRLPPPACAIVADGCGCTEYYGWGDDIKKRLKVPLMTIHTPINWKGGDVETGIAEESIAATVDGLKKMIAFVEDLSGVRLDWDKLKEMMAVAKRAEAVKQEAVELCKNIPSPASGFDWGTTQGASFHYWGREESVQVFEAMKREMEERVARKEGAVIGEKYRLMWEGLGCWTYFGRLAKKFASLGACVVASDGLAGTYPYCDIDPEDPLRSVALRMAAGAGRTLEWGINRCIKQVREFSADGVVCHAHYTCRPMSALQPAYMDALSRRADIPSTFFEADMADPSYYSDAQIDTRLQALLEVIDAKKKRQKPL